MRRKVEEETSRIITYAKFGAPYVLVLGLCSWLSLKGYSWTKVFVAMVAARILWQIAKGILAYRNFKGNRKTGRCLVSKRQYRACPKCNPKTLTLMGSCGYLEEGNRCRWLLRRRSGKIRHRNPSAPKRKPAVRVQFTR